MSVRGGDGLRLLLLLSIEVLLALLVWHAAELIEEQVGLLLLHARLHVALLHARLQAGLLHVLLVLLLLHADGLHVGRHAALLLL